MSEKIKEVKLSEFVENPDNPQTVTDDRFKALVEKLRRNPNGLKADRIAYVTDNPAGKYVVLSGNKRLRALKEIYCPGGQVDAEWFQDITGMSEDERSEFIVSANVNEGKFDADKMLKLYDKDELKSWMGAEVVDQLIAITEAGPAQQDGQIVFDYPRHLTPGERLLVSSFPTDYQATAKDVPFLTGMSVAPVQMAHIADAIYNQWLKPINERKN